MKRLNRKDFLLFLIELTKCDKASINPIGKNSFLLQTGNEDIYQVEFIPQTDKYFFTLYLRGISKVADEFNKPIVEYLRSLELGRNMVVDTEYIVTFV